MRLSTLSAAHSPAFALVYNQKVCHVHSRVPLCSPMDAGGVQLGVNFQVPRGVGDDFVCALSLPDHLCV